MRAPDIEGRAGRAWLVGRPTDDPADTTASIAAYLMHVPGAHPFWAWYRLDVVHLRDIAGQKHPPVKHYPEAEYEFLIVALDPASSSYDPEDPRSHRPLTPVNVLEQFHQLNDEQAAHLAKMATSIICRGLTSPDSDYRTWWKTAIPNTIHHILTGGHHHPKA